MLGLTSFFVILLASFAVGIFEDICYDESVLILPLNPQRYNLSALNIGTRNLTNDDWKAAVHGIDHCREWIYWIYMDNNLLETFDTGDICDLPRVFWLGLQHNRIRTVSQSRICNSSVDLEELYISNNLIELIDLNAFKGFPNLYRLSLYQNRLFMIEAEGPIVGTPLRLMVFSGDSNKGAELCGDFQEVFSIAHLKMHFDWESPMCKCEGWTNLGYLPPESLYFPRFLPRWYPCTNSVEKSGIGVTCHV